MQLTQEQIKSFQEKIYEHYRISGRIFTWRQTTNPYHIFVSEVMLQQTQTIRVAKKYEEFIRIFPDFAALANAELYNVLKVWQGLGYNRRAKFLHQSAKIICSQYKNKVPDDIQALQALPGIGAATAASIAAFAFNKPTVFVETNIRVVFIHLFLSHKHKICDRELLSLAKQTLDTTNPRKWYYALTDYGAMLKSQGINPINKSKAYTKQSKFQGSDRQIRGVIIKQMLANKNLSMKQLCEKINTLLGAEPERVEKIAHQLIEESLIEDLS